MRLVSVTPTHTPFRFYCAGCGQAKKASRDHVADLDAPPFTFYCAQCADDKWHAHLGPREAAQLLGLPVRALEEDTAQ